MVAVGTRTGKIEVFFVDPTTGALLDGTALVAGGPVQPHVTIVTNVGNQQLAMGDVNHDGILDIVSARYIGQGSAVRLSVGQRSANGVISYTVVTVPPPAQQGAFGYDVAIGDLDGDGFDEILVTKGSSGGKGHTPRRARPCWSTQRPMACRRSCRRSCRRHRPVDMVRPSVSATSMATVCRTWRSEPRAG
jgi:hypothetical protein